MKIFILAAALIGVTGCMVQAHSSQAVLGPEGSTIVVQRTPADAAVEITKLLTVRGYALVDQRPDQAGGVLLRLKGTRKTLTHADEDTTSSTQFGSVFYVLVEPRTAARTAVTILGRPTLDGRETCTPGLSYGECEVDEVKRVYADEMSGHAEAEVVHGVFSELRLLGVVATP